MASRLKIPLVVLCILVITYVGLHADDFRGPLEDVEVKGKKNSTTSSPFPTSTTINMSSATLQQLEMGQIKGLAEVVDDGSDDDDDNQSPSTDLLDNHILPNASTTSSDQSGNTSNIAQENRNTTGSGNTSNSTEDNPNSGITSNTTQENPDGGNTSNVMQKNRHSGTSTTAPACCLHPSIDLTTRLTPEFFEYQRTSGIDPKTEWSGKEYEEWLAISARLNPNHTDTTNLDCTTQYILLVLEQVSGFYLRMVLTELGNGSLDSFPFYEETPGLPRILLLGDSISRGIRNQTQYRYHGQANIQGAPTNALGFSRYKTGLKQWLGDCPWDLVQFNVGMHFHPRHPDDYPSWHKEYTHGIIHIVKKIRKHSPKAQIVFALTTPSPFDSKATTPKKSACPNYDKFHKAGFVPAMNDVVKSVAETLDIAINDRYSAILPVLKQYQRECDVHFSIGGYERLAEQDWKVFSALLSINSTRSEAGNTITITTINSDNDSINDTRDEAGNTTDIPINSENISINDTHGEAGNTSAIIINSEDNSTNETRGEPGNTPTIVINSDHKTSPTTDPETPECCLRPSVDLEEKLTPDFFNYQRTSGIDPQTKWTGKEYEEWVAIWARLNPNHENQTNLDCPTQYKLLVLDQVSGFYLRTVMTELVNGRFSWIPYYKETPGLPRILLLGDSISRGIRSQTQQLYHSRANIQGAPTNCNGFEKYELGLQHWLGYCPWNLVQFNVGMHFHPEFPDNYTSWREEYRQGITNVVNDIRAHSPSAHIVFALTTPSPFDSHATTPNRASCPNYDKFHKAGFVSAMNEVARSISEELGIIINDRYSAILPVLGQYQKKCDVHYYDNGYKFIARQDWKVFSEALSL